MPVPGYTIYHWMRLLSHSEPEDACSLQIGRTQYYNRPRIENKHYAQHNFETLI